MEVEGVEKVKAFIADEIKRRKIASIALCRYYAARALENFRVIQNVDGFWTNRTESALAEVFSGAINEDGEIGFFLAHAVDYGVYLELANDRKHEALRPIIMDLYPEFEKDLKEIWA